MIQVAEIEKITCPLCDGKQMIRRYWYEHTIFGIEEKSSAVKCHRCKGTGKLAKTGETNADYQGR